MIVGFLVSRVALSISMFLFGINAIRDVSPRQWLKQKWWLLGMIWVAIYAVTYFWSDDKANWHTRLEVKLPFLLLPLAFSFLPPFSKKQLQIFTVTTALLFVAASMYSVSFLIREPAYYISQYKQSHVLPTLPKYDHIRASLAIVLFMIWSIYVWPSLQGKTAKWIVGTSLFLLVIYVHILAAKSGMVSLYIFVVLWGIYLAFGKKKLLGFLIIISIPISFFIAIKCIPTFYERANYVGFSVIMFRNGDTTGKYGDIARIMSYRLATRLIAAHPLTGVGTGDMHTEMNHAYDIYYPATPVEGRLIPHDQFLIVALGCGIPAMIIFLIWVFMPLAQIRRNRAGFFFFAVWFLLFLQLLIEPVLEVQFGVFLYLFFLLMQKHELPAIKREALPQA